MEVSLHCSNNYSNHLYFSFAHEIELVDFQFCRHTHGSLFSSEPNMIMDLRAFQSCRTLSNASWANRGGSRSWSGISESERQEIRLVLWYSRSPDNRGHRLTGLNCWKIEDKTFALNKAFKMKIGRIHRYQVIPSALAALRFLSSLMRGGLYWQCSTLCLATVCTRNSKICSPLQREWKLVANSRFSFCRIKLRTVY